MRITVAALNARYQSSRKPLYSGFSADFPDGKITGLFGPNGVGKSSLLRLLAHLTDGMVSNADRSVTWDVTDGYISYVPQGYSACMMPWLSVDENVYLPLYPLPNINHQEITDRCAALKEVFDIAYDSKYPTGLSGGQQQIIVLLRALIRRPDFLILDEPFSSLDIYSGAQFRERYMGYLKDHRITTVFVTHDLHECARFSDRIMFLDSDESGLTSLKGTDESPIANDVSIQPNSYLSSMSIRDVKGDGK